jgi:glutamyl-tRNA synthetase
MENDAKIRVRYAPSPTGRLHVGGVRTALFNWLFARKNGGTFVLRIEDTDLERSTEESVEQLGRSMRWIGLDWDEGPEAGGPHSPYRQTERFDLYREAARKLLDSGAAYYDFATPEDLAGLRERARAEGRQPIYTGGEYREMDPDEAGERVAAGEPYTVRFKTPREGQTVVQDMIRGPITFENANLEDFVLMKSTDTPTYNFAAAFDDAEMEISHVIRGDDHLSNTPRQILIHEALGNPLPGFAHVPQVLGVDKKKLSKRHGAASVEDFAERGYLPEALFNYLALLGAGYAADEEIFTPEELAQSGGATEEELERDPARLEEIMDLLKERIALTTEIPDSVGYFYGGSLDYDEAEFEKQFSKEFVRENFPDLVERLTALPEWTQTAIEEAVRGLAAEKEKGARHLIHPLRFAVTGRTVSAGLFETMQLLRRERSLLRAGDATQKMQRLPV